MTMLRRFLVLAAFAFWQGGFTFYAGVAIPVGRGVEPDVQTVITSSVTYYLNLSGIAALMVLAWEFVPVEPVRWQRLGRVGLWSVMLFLLGVLFWLHGQLIQSRLAGDFNWTYHKIYLWVSTVQWACACAYLVLTLFAWRAQDRVVIASSDPPRLS